MDHLIPLDRRHNAKQPTNSHPFHMPSESELTTLIFMHISSMNTASSPGFDTITPAFIKCACKRVPRHQGRGMENVNVYAVERALREEPVRELTNHPDSSKFLVRSECGYQGSDS
eukprot:1138102-Pelagomonas_calceolata.AAC.2